MPSKNCAPELPQDFKKTLRDRKIKDKRDCKILLRYSIVNTADFGIILTKMVPLSRNKNPRVFGGGNQVKKFDIDRDNKILILLSSLKFRPVRF